MEDTLTRLVSVRVLLSSLLSVTATKTKNKPLKIPLHRFVDVDALIAYYIKSIACRLALPSTTAKEEVAVSSHRLDSP